MLPWFGWPVTRTNVSRRDDAATRRARPLALASGATSARRGAAAITVVVGSAILAGSGFAVWLDVAGVRLSGFRLAEIVGGQWLPGMPDAWVGVAWYLFPAAAGICWTLLFWHLPPTVSPLHSAIGAAVAIAAAVYAARVDPLTGPLLALAGGLIIAAGGLAGRRRATAPHEGVDRND